MVKVHHLNCVEILSPGYGRAIGHCLLIETENKLILIDAGIGLQDTENPNNRLGQHLIDMVGFRFNREWTAIHQIQLLGLDPEKVTDCVLSHLDPDHIGALVDFPHAILHMSQEEYDNFRLGNPRYLEHQLHHDSIIKTYASSDDTWCDMEARKLSLASTLDIYLIPLFGHTRGHCGIALDLGAEKIFYVGDAYYLRSELTDNEHPVHKLAELRADDNRLRQDALTKIRHFILQHPETTVYSYHDPSEFPRN